MSSPTTRTVQARAIPLAVVLAARARAATENVPLRAVIETALREYGSRRWTPPLPWSPPPTTTS